MSVWQRGWLLRLSMTSTSNDSAGQQVREKKFMVIVKNSVPLVGEIKPAMVGNAFGNGACWMEMDGKIIMLSLSAPAPSLACLLSSNPGGLQIFKNNNALFKAGLSPSQTFLYFWAGFSTCLSVAMLYLIICPLLFLLGQDTFKLATFDTYEYFLFFLPFMLAQSLLMVISYRGVPSPTLKRSFQESVFMLFCYIRAVITVMLGIKLGFKVTNKDGETSAFRKSLNWCIPFLIYYLTAIPSIVFGVLKIIQAYYSTPKNDYSTMIAVSVSIFWIVMMMWQMWPPLGVLLDEMWRSTAINQRKAVEEEEEDNNDEARHHDDAV